MILSSRCNGKRRRLHRIRLGLQPKKPGRRGLPWPFRRSNKGAGDGRPGNADFSPASPTAPFDPPTRRHAFRAALQGGDSIAHLFASNIIDPIRADTHVPGDPFVQTTLYVIAPLYEPLTSALIWPTIAHQLNYLGQRHIAQVVGIFAAGSYATDSSRTIEDASATRLWPSWRRSPVCAAPT